MAHEHEEGWYTDPFGRHDARWMSLGTPTKLVRDGGVESYDDPPDEEPSQVATRIVEEPPAGIDDLRRADDAETQPVPTDGKFADVSAFGAVSTWHLHPPDADKDR